MASAAPPDQISNDQQEFGNDHEEEEAVEETEWEAEPTGSDFISTLRREIAEIVAEKIEKATPKKELTEEDYDNMFVKLCEEHQKKKKLLCEDKTTESSLLESKVADH